MESIESVKALVFQEVLRFIISTSPSFLDAYSGNCYS